MIRIFMLTWPWDSERRTRKTPAMPPLLPGKQLSVESYNSVDVSVLSEPQPPGHDSKPHETFGDEEEVKETAAEVNVGKLDSAFLEPFSSRKTETPLTGEDTPRRRPSKKFANNLAFLGDDGKTEAKEVNVGKLDPSYIEMFGNKGTDDTPAKGHRRKQSVSSGKLFASNPAFDDERPPPSPESATAINSDDLKSQNKEVATKTLTINETPMKPVTLGDNESVIVSQHSSPVSAASSSKEESPLDTESMTDITAGRNVNKLDPSLTEAFLKGHDRSSSSGIDVNKLDQSMIDQFKQKEDEKASSNINVNKLPSSMMTPFLQQQKIDSGLSRNTGKRRSSKASPSDNPKEEQLSTKSSDGSLSNQNAGRDISLVASSTRKPANDTQATSQARTKVVEEPMSSQKYSLKSAPNTTCDIGLRDRPEDDTNGHKQRKIIEEPMTSMFYTKKAAANIPSHFEDADERPTVKGNDFCHSQSEGRPFSQPDDGTRPQAEDGRPTLSEVNLSQLPPNCKSNQLSLGQTVSTDRPTAEPSSESSDLQADKSIPGKDSLNNKQSHLTDKSERVMSPNMEMPIWSKDQDKDTNWDDIQAITEPPQLLQADTFSSGYESVNEHDTQNCVSTYKSLDHAFDKPDAENFNDSFNCQSVSAQQQKPSQCLANEQGQLKLPTNGELDLDTHDTTTERINNDALLESLNIEEIPEHLQGQQQPAQRLENEQEGQKHMQADRLLDENNAKLAPTESIIGKLDAAYLDPFNSKFKDTESPGGTAPRMKLSTFDGGNIEAAPKEINVGKLDPTFLELFGRKGNDESPPQGSIQITNSSTHSNGEQVTPPIQQLKSVHYKDDVSHSTPTDKSGRSITPVHQGLNMITLVESSSDKSSGSPKTEQSPQNATPEDTLGLNTGCETRATSDNLSFFTFEQSVSNMPTRKDSFKTGGKEKDDDARFEALPGGERFFKTDEKNADTSDELSNFDNRPGFEESASSKPVSSKDSYMAVREGPMGCKLLMEPYSEGAKKHTSYEQHSLKPDQTTSELSSDKTSLRSTSQNRNEEFPDSDLRLITLNPGEQTEDIAGDFISGPVDMIRDNDFAHKEFCKPGNDLDRIVPSDTVSLKSTDTTDSTEQTKETDSNVRVLKPEYQDKTTDVDNIQSCEPAVSIGPGDKVHVNSVQRMDPKEGDKEQLPNDDARGIAPETEDKSMTDRLRHFIFGAPSQKPEVQEFKGETSVHSTSRDKAGETQSTDLSSGYMTPIAQSTLSQGRPGNHSDISIQPDSALLRSSQFEKTGQNNESDHMTTSPSSTDTRDRQLPSETSVHSAPRGEAGEAVAGETQSTDLSSSDIAPMAQSTLSRGRSGNHSDNIQPHSALLAPSQFDKTGHINKSDHMTTSTSSTDTRDRQLPSETSVHSAPRGEAGEAVAGETQSTDLSSSDMAPMAQSTLSRGRSGNHSDNIQPHSALLAPSQFDITGHINKSDHMTTSTSSTDTRDRQMPVKGQENKIEQTFEKAHTSTEHQILLMQPIESLAKDEDQTPSPVYETKNRTLAPNDIENALEQTFEWLTDLESVSSSQEKLQLRPHVNVIADNKDENKQTSVERIIPSKDPGNTLQHSPGLTSIAIGSTSAQSLMMTPSVKPPPTGNDKQSLSNDMKLEPELGGARILKCGESPEHEDGSPKRVRSSKSLNTEFSDSKELAPNDCEVQENLVTFQTVSMNANPIRFVSQPDTNTNSSSDIRDGSLNIEALSIDANPSTVAAYQSNSAELVVNSLNPVEAEDGSLQFITSHGDTFEDILPSQTLTLESPLNIHGHESTDSPTLKLEQDESCPEAVSEDESSVTKHRQVSEKEKKEKLKRTKSVPNQLKKVKSSEATQVKPFTFSSSRSGRKGMDKAIESQNVTLSRTDRKGSIAPNTSPAAKQWKKSTNAQKVVSTLKSAPKIEAKLKTKPADKSTNQIKKATQKTTEAKPFSFQSRVRKVVDKDDSKPTTQPSMKKVVNESRDRKLKQSKADPPGSPKAQKLSVGSPTTRSGQPRDGTQKKAGNNPRIPQSPKAKTDEREGSRERRKQLHRRASSKSEKNESADTDDTSLSDEDRQKQGSKPSHKRMKSLRSVLKLTDPTSLIHEVDADGTDDTKSLRRKKKNRVRFVDQEHESLDSEHESSDLEMREINCNEVQNSDHNSKSLEDQTLNPLYTDHPHSTKVLMSKQESLLGRSETNTTFAKQNRDALIIVKPGQNIGETEQFTNECPAEGITAFTSSEGFTQFGNQGEDSIIVKQCKPLQQAINQPASEGTASSAKSERPDLHIDLSASERTESMIEEALLRSDERYNDSTMYMDSPDTNFTIRPTLPNHNRQPSFPYEEDDSSNEAASGQSYITVGNSQLKAPEGVKSLTLDSPEVGESEDCLTAEAPKGVKSLTLDSPGVVESDDCLTTEAAEGVKSLTFDNPEIGESEDCLTTEAVESLTLAPKEEQEEFMEGRETVDQSMIKDTITLKEGLKDPKIEFKVELPEELAPKAIRGPKVDRVERILPRLKRGTVKHQREWYLPYMEAEDGYLETKPGQPATVSKKQLSGHKQDSASLRIGLRRLLGKTDGNKETCSITTDKGGESTESASLIKRDDTSHSVTTASGGGPTYEVLSTGSDVKRPLASLVGGKEEYFISTDEGDDGASVQSEGEHPSGAVASREEYCIPLAERDKLRIKRLWSIGYKGSRGRSTKPTLASVVTELERQRKLNHVDIDDTPPEPAEPIVIPGKSVLDLVRGFETIKNTRGKPDN